jgi:hypothetical protein
MRAHVTTLLGLVMGTVIVAGQQGPAPVGYDDTPMQPNGRWRIHDGKRPQPPIVTPGAMTPAPAPQDAIVLVGAGADRGAWQMMDGTAVTWPMTDGVLSTGEGMIRTRAEFTDYQLHVEFATPKDVKGNSQERGNSGVFLMGLYEVQVLDSWNNLTYADGQAGAIYGQSPPMVNASRKPGEWQAYDIVFEAPRFKDGKLETPAYVTVFHNGVLVQNHTKIIGTTRHKLPATYDPHPAKASLRLQDHGNPMHFRNIWIRPLELKP